jgi:hypothetical protein
MVYLWGYPYQSAHHQSVRNTLLKQGYTETKKREKRLFDVDDLVNVPISLWTEDGSVFIHLVIRHQITFLLLAYCFQGCALELSFTTIKAEAKRENGLVNRRV